MFNKLLHLNCYSKNKLLKSVASNLLEKFYGCEINCVEIAESVLFAHHARGCTLAAAKIDANAVIFQNVTIGSNLKYNKITKEWENVGNPVIGKNTVVADGAKVLGPVIIGPNSVVAAGAIITKDIPANSIAYGMNQFRPKDPDYDLVFSRDMIAPEKIIAACQQLIVKYEEEK